MSETITKSRSKKTNVQQKNKQTKKKKSLVKKIFLTCIGLFSITTIAAIIISVTFIISAPKLTQEDLIGTLPSTIYDKNDNAVYKLGGTDRILIDPSSIPKNIENAILSIEDRRFYDHSGIDIIRIGGSLISNFTKGGLQGGSTITQQLVKLSVFSTSTKDQTIKRKIQEIWLSLELEKEYTKKDILALYLNKVFLANNVYGFGTAAQYYFNKPAEQLTIAQAALFAGMVQAPSTYNPLLHPEEATNRRNVVLSAMLNNNKITKEEYDQAIATAVTDGIVDRTSSKSTTELALDAYVQVVIDEIKQKTNLDPYTQGLNIYTTLDFNAQNKLTELLDNEQVIDWPNKTIQAAVTIMNPNDGSIVAMSGGRNTAVLLGTNRATSQNRSVGSTAKPLIDYGPAIEYLNYSTGQILLDAPIKYTNGPDLNNYDKRYFGNMTMRQALVQSKNTPALRTYQAVGQTNARAFLAKNGIVKSSLVESNAIGFEASTLQMSAAYSAFSNGGTYYEPYTIRKVVTRSGEAQEYTGIGTRSMSDYTAYMITDMLKDVPGNTAPYAAAANLYQAGKTGSTNYTDEQYKIVTNNRNVSFASVDAWYVGYTRDYVIASWVGYDKPLEAGNYVGIEQYIIPQLIYKNMISYLSGTSNKNWERPNSVATSGSELYIRGSKNIPSIPQIQTTQPTETTTATQSSYNDESSSEIESSTIKSSNSTTRQNSRTTQQETTTTTRQTTKVQ